MNVSFFGMGVMGSNMAINLCKSGFSVTIHNRTCDTNGVRRAISAGAHFKGFDQALDESDVILSCLGDESSLLDFVEKAAPRAKGKLFIDFTTVGVQAAKEANQLLNNHQANFVDAPVSGGEEGAINGSLTIMYGASREVSQEIETLFKAVANNVFFCGPVGSGQSVKLVNQLLCAINLIGVGEAFKAARGLGVDESIIVDVCSTGAAASWQLDNLGRKFINKDFSPGFKISHLRKDLRLVGEDTPASAQLPLYVNSQHYFDEYLEKEGRSADDEGTQAVLKIFGHRDPHKEN